MGVRQGRTDIADEVIRHTEDEGELGGTRERGRTQWETGIEMGVELEQSVCSIRMDCGESSGRVERGVW